MENAAWPGLFRQVFEYDTSLLSGVMGEEFCAEGLPKPSCFGFGFEGLDFVTDALVGSAACPFGLEWDWFIDVWEGFSSPSPIVMTRLGPDPTITFMAADFIIAYR